MLFKALHEHKLSEFKLEVDSRTATTVILASGGYPEGYEKGKEIAGLANVPNDVLVFHAGTKQVNDKLLNNGGRVFAVTALGDTMEQALEKANAAAEVITWQDRYYRRDIGFDLRKLTV